MLQDNLRVVTKGDRMVICQRRLREPPGPQSVARLINIATPRHSRDKESKRGVEFFPASKLPYQIQICGFTEIWVFGFPPTDGALTKANAQNSYQAVVVSSANNMYP